VPVLSLLPVRYLRYAEACSRYEQGTLMKISRLGEAPDYRFSLANERTFLAWIRTALGFLPPGSA
jgi:hypothetical protein